MLFASYRELPRDIKVLFVARIVNRMGDFVRVFLTLFLTLSLKLDETQTGKVIMVVALFSMAGSWIGGRLADKKGRKKILIVFQFISAALIAATGFLPERDFFLYLIPALLILSQFFHGAIRPVNTAMVSDHTTAENRKAAFSLLYLGINIGFAIGPILAGFLFNNHRQWIFWGDAITSVTAGLLVLFYVREIPPEKRIISSDKEKAHHGGLWKALMERPVLFCYMLTSILTAFIYGQASFSMPLMLNDVFGEQGPMLLGSAHSVNAVTVLLFTPVILWLGKKQKPLFQIAQGALAYALGFGLMGFSGQSTMLIFIFTWVWTMGEILIATNGGTFMANHSPVNLRGQINAFHHVLYGLGSAFTPLVSGIIIARYGINTIWGICFCLGIISMIIMLLLKRADAKKGAPSGLPLNQ